MNPTCPFFKPKSIFEPDLCHYWRTKGYVSGYCVHR